MANSPRGLGKNKKKSEREKKLLVFCASHYGIDFVSKIAANELLEKGKLLATPVDAT